MFKAFKPGVRDACYMFLAGKQMIEPICPLGGRGLGGHLPSTMPFCMLYFLAGPLRLNSVLQPSLAARSLGSGKGKVLALPLWAVETW